ncbi:MAG: hypothetical protein LBD28_02895 [Tannerellaceae bacterium]|nr:hypothetical protein [Tannerellaceae bacterium]
MIRIISVPKSGNVEFSIPEEYIGKEVEIIVFPKEEVANKTDNDAPASVRTNENAGHDRRQPDNLLDRMLTIVNPYI